MIKTAGLKPAPDPDPRRLLDSAREAAPLLRSYARRTTPGDRDGVAAWYRLRPHLEAAVDVRGEGAVGRWRPVWSTGRVFTVALGLLLLLKMLPSDPTPTPTPTPESTRSNRVPALDTARPTGPADAPSGSITGGGRGVGGMEGSTGARGSGGTAAAGGLAVWPGRLG